MPDTITTPDGVVYWKMGWTGIALGPAAIYGIVPEETTYEYWIYPWDDTKRLHAADPERWYLD